VTCLGALIVGVTALLVLELVGVNVTLTASGVALLAVLAVLILALVYPRHLERLLERLSNVKFAGVELGLVQAERASVAERLPAREEDFGKIPIPELRTTGTVLGDLREIRVCLVERLEWLADELTLGQSEPDEILKDLAAPRTGYR
jgi:hypothetical protein